jgi:rhamnosyltransferase
MRRAAIYVIHDSDGILDAYRRYYLHELRGVADYILAIVNGDISTESRVDLEPLVDDVIYRENTGYDTYAFIEGIAYIRGGGGMQLYESLIMANDSVYGPFFPFSEMFEVMDERDVDFWAVNKISEIKTMKVWNGRKLPKGHFIGHLSSSFYVICDRLLHSDDFARYWKQEPAIDEYYDAVWFNEIAFYEYVYDRGYVIDSFQDDQMSKYDSYQTIRSALLLLEKYRCPLLRKKVFTKEVANSLAVHDGRDARLALEFIRYNTDYDETMIWKNLLRTENQYDLFNRLQLTYIVPDESTAGAPAHNKRIAVIIHIYYPDLVDECTRYAKNFPPSTKFFITTTSHSCKSQIEESFSSNELDYVITIIPNAGRDVPALLVTYKDTVLGGDYEYICFYHDKKSEYLNLAVMGEHWRRRGLDNICGSSEIISSIVKLFEGNACLGVIGSPWPYNGKLMNVVSSTWEKNYSNTLALMQMLGIDVPIDIKKPAIAPYGAGFWFRSKALKGLYARDWIYSDFIDTSISIIDGKLEHAFERIYAFAAQSCGYYYAEVISPDYAKADIINYRYMYYTLLENLQTSSIVDGFAGFDSLLKKIDVFDSAICSRR